MPGSLKVIIIHSVFCLDLKYFQRKAAAVYPFSLVLVFSGYVATKSQRGAGGRHGAQCENFGLEVTVSSKEQSLAWWYKGIFCAS